MIRFATKVAPEAGKIERAWSCGFRHAEIWLSKELLGRGLEEILAGIPGVPMSYALHFPNRGPLSDGELDTAQALYRALECRAMVIHEPMLLSCGSRLAERCPGMRLAVENGRQRGERFWAWATSHRWLTLDVEHVWKYALEDGPMAELRKVLTLLLSRYHSRVIHVHLPGYVPGAPEHRPLATNAALARLVWDLLEGYGYDEFVVSEANLEYQTETHLRRDAALFEEWRDGCALAWA